MTELLNLVVDLYIIFADAFVEFCVIIISTFNWTLIKHNLWKSFIQCITYCLVSCVSIKNIKKYTRMIVKSNYVPDFIKLIIANCALCHIANTNDKELLQIAMGMSDDNISSTITCILMFIDENDFEFIKHMYSYQEEDLRLMYEECKMLIFNNNIKLLKLILSEYEDGTNFTCTIANMFKISIYYDMTSIGKYIYDTYKTEINISYIYRQGIHNIGLSILQTSKNIIGVKDICELEFIFHGDVNLNGIKYLVEECGYKISRDNIQMLFTGWCDCVSDCRTKLDDPIKTINNFGDVHLKHVTNEYYNFYKYILRVMVDPEKMANDLFIYNAYPSMVDHLIKIGIDSTKLTGRIQYKVENILFRPQLEKIIHPHLVGDILRY